ncbi:HAMP domain-containing sensor histidine kinase [uncultured Algibacter sp.]|uniref:sensor histidine kinase n=1 Tax=uncultured Algibacter sp. TaxID=298659 RepID=UPI0026228BAF|nr:HAMP domain-containing sensor histidine kinase [uncultured Algibacter sp.]
MNDKKYTWLLYLIVTTIVLTIAVQGYWNYKNYLLNKQYFTNQVQVSLDNALDTYYADLAESNEMTIIESDSIYFNEDPHSFNPDSILRNIEFEYKNIHDKGISGFTKLNDSSGGYSFKKGQEHISKIKVLRGKKATDSIKLLKGITSIFISIKNDSLDFSKLNPLVEKELKRKQLDIPFALKHFKGDSLFNSINLKKADSNFLKAESKSTFLKNNEKLIIAYPNATHIILKQGLSTIIISTLLVFVIIGCLLYLLKIIQQQKQLAEVKNDLISNITHEFKTPIATIGVALESIKNFNVIDNKEKTKSYLNISSNQLSKLNVMVEKLLETATLDSDNLKLNKEAYTINDILDAILAKHKLQCENKTINFLGSSKNIVGIVDSFHFENAINNILDNAIKYGGDVINIELSQDAKDFYVSISDNGNSITKANTDKIFEKFYRIPKGNTHDVKGFGIGLYYTKKIIEKHNGTINLDLSNNLTTFKITLPND